MSIFGYIGTGVAAFFGALFVLRFVLCAILVLEAVSIQAIWLEPVAVLARTWDMTLHWAPETER